MIQDHCQHPDSSSELLSFSCQTIHPIGPALLSSSTKDIVDVFLKKVISVSFVTLLYHHKNKMSNSFLLFFILFSSCVFIILLSLFYQLYFRIRRLRSAPLRLILSFPDPSLSGFLFPNPSVRIPRFRFFFPNPFYSNLLFRIPPVSKCGTADHGDAPYLPVSYGDSLPAPGEYFSPFLSWPVPGPSGR